jgi:outer membrane protein assembly factor BamA
MSTIQLPAPISAYFSSKGGADPGETLACFADDATVWDNGEDLELKGIDQIRGWLTSTVSSYNLSSEVRTVEQREGRYSVGVVVSGDFPGSPYAFDYRFHLRGQKIAELAIDPVGPISAEGCH